ncbi:MAG: U32 family peptidase [Kiritimatiellia bacterium]
MNNNINEKMGGDIELLAPAGSVEAGYAALHYGADAIYLGLEKFSARASATNLSLDDLNDIAGYAHSRPKKRKIYLAINTLVLQSELGGLVDLLGNAAAIGIDAVIVQDMGVLHILRRYFPQVKIHASTQMAVHNLAGAEAAGRMGVKRVTLARELTLAEIAGIASGSGIETEVFIHGALCYSYSGLCLFSSHISGRSGNRGKCAYPCRERFEPESPEFKNKLMYKHFRDTAGPEALALPMPINSVKGRAAAPHNAGQASLFTTPEAWPRRSSLSGKDAGFIFSMKDLALPGYVPELRRIGVTALKIEGRMKSPLYVAAAVNFYRHLIDGNLGPDKERELAAEVQTIFSRPWTELYIRGRRNRGVTDIETMGHRGSPAGTAEEIVKNQGGHALRFKTNLPLELHDGLQIDIAGQPRPFGFAVKGINIMGAGDGEGRKRVFTAPAGAKVEIQLPRGHPLIPKGAVIYSASSQKVKQRYDFHMPKPGQYRQRHAADFELRLDENGCEAIASATVLSAATGENIRVEAKRHYEEKNEPAENAGKIDEAFRQAFGKLGDTNLKTGSLKLSNPLKLFVPISRLNAIRRDIAAALQEQINALSRKYAEYIKSDLAGQKEKTSNRLHKQNWSIKTDQPHLLEAFEKSDWCDVDEAIIECLPGNPSGLCSRLEKLAGAAGKERVRLSIPVIIREWEMESLSHAVSELIAQGWRKWQVPGPGGLGLLAGRDNENKLDITADWPFYAMNRAAALELKSLGLDRFTLSPEDGLENMRALLAEFAESATVIVYQDTPLMVSETCVFSSEGCRWPEKCHARNMIFGSSGGARIRVAGRQCRSVVLNARPFCLAGRLEELAEAGALNLRADFIYRKYSEKELLDTWRKLRSGDAKIPGHEGNFRRGF